MVVVREVCTRAEHAAKLRDGIAPREVRRTRLIKLDIVNAVLSKLEGAPVSRVKAEQAVETVFESLKNGMGRSQRIELRRFGVFTVKPRKTGIGRNPRTGQEVNIPPGKAVRFKPGKELQGLEA